MISKANIVVIATFCVSSYSAAAASNSGEYSKCLAKAEAVDPVILECMESEYDRQDKRLNTAYKNLLNGLSGTRKKQLQDIQRLWLKYTEANCGFYYGDSGGSLDRQISFQCSIDARAARATELERLSKF